MSAEKKEKKTKYTSPKGEFQYPYLNEPDTKFKEEGEYRVSLRLPAEKAAPLVAMIDKAAAEALKEAKKGAKTPKEAAKWETKFLPYSVETDEEDVETGFVIFKFSSKASGVTKTGREWSRSVPLFDSQGNLLPRKDGKFTVSVWSGSEGYVSYTIQPYAPNTQIGASVSLGLEAVQITKLVSGGNQSAEDYGFGKEEGGFETPADSEEADVSEDAEEKEDDGSGDF